MHHTTLTYLDARRAYSETDPRRPDELGRNGTLLETAFRAWRSAGYPDVDPGPEADLRAELEAARADHLADVNARAAESTVLRAKLQAMHRQAQGAEAERDTLAQRLEERDAELRIAREEHAELRAIADGLREQRNAAHAESAAWRRIADDNAASATHWRKVAEELAARPRLRDRVWRWVGVTR